VSRLPSLKPTYQQNTSSNLLCSNKNLSEISQHVINTLDWFGVDYIIHENVIEAEYTQVRRNKV
jgi:hypothetical protein